ncbi:MAG TPA: DUF4350 domain-containing protein [Pyrinomonadaceae bacterium]|jgi:hypothetical protein|nr:DUF4350 domain-containing protein [Pyrinomonadaceae bacterium]
MMFGLRDSSSVGKLASSLAVAALLFAGVFATAAGQQIPDPTFKASVERPAFRTKHPKVLFDEAHNNYHTAGGRYKAFADLITGDGYAVVPNKEKFSRQSLTGYNILIISNALGSADLSTPAANDPAFTEEECDAVRDWVRAGGSLLLIADHFPVGGANANLARRFGVELSNAFTDDPANYDKELQNILFSRENKLLADHPITRGRDARERINRIVTFTGQSLKGPSAAFSFLRLADTAVDRLPPDGEKRVPAAGRSQGLALKMGKGRVVVMGEAAMLTAQLAGPEKAKFGGLNVSGIDNRQLALNIMHWLSKVLN